MLQTKRTRRRGQRRQASETRRRLWPVIVVVVLIFFGVGGFFYLRSVVGNPAATPGAGTPPAGATPIPSELGQAVPIQGQQHVQPGEAHPEYNSDPPTSGWHLDNAIRAGFYKEPQLDEALVHNLEHGHIVIAYDCEKLTNCDDVKAKLKAIFDRYNGWKITVVPRNNKDAPLALTAWGRILKLDDYDEASITAFINAYRDKGPEKTPE